MIQTVRKSLRARYQFAKEYIRTGNCTQAYRSLGPLNGNDNTIKKDAYNYLHHPQVQTIVERLRQRAAQKALTSVEEIVAENLAIIRFDPARLFDENGDLLKWEDIQPEDRRCITEVNTETAVDQTGHVRRTTTVKTAASARGAALDRLARMMGAYARDNAQKTAADEAAAAAALATANNGDAIVLAQKLAFLLNEGIRASKGLPVVTQSVIEHEST